MEKEKKPSVRINLRGTVGVRGQYYGPGEGVEVPYDVAESIALSQGKSVDEMKAEVQSVPKAEPTKPKAEK
jgi:hypothetical protein